MTTTDGARGAIEDLLDQTLPGGLERPWPDDRPLTDAGLDSVAVLELVGALERRFGFRLADEDLDASNFLTITGLLALVARRSRT